MSIQIDKTPPPAVSQTAVHKQPVQAQPSLSSVLYSERVSGKNYSVDVMPVDSGYEAKVPNVPGISVTGPTVDRVEERLNSIISFIV